MPLNMKNDALTSSCVPPSMRNDEYYALLNSVVSVECCDVSANDVRLCWSASQCMPLNMKNDALMSSCVPPSMRNDEYYALLISVVSVECCDVSANEVRLYRSASQCMPLNMKNDALMSSIY